MDSGKRYFYNLVQSLHKPSVPGGRDSLLGAVVQFERHLKAKGIFLTGLTVILIPSNKMLSYVNNSRESWQFGIIADIRQVINVFQTLEVVEMKIILNLNCPIMDMQTTFVKKIFS